jgi:hypothetical protein
MPLGAPRVALVQELLSLVTVWLEGPLLLHSTLCPAEMVIESGEK